MAVDEVAKKANVTGQKILDWEAGTSKPTARQGRILAQCYNRHFLEFFSDTIPKVKDVQLVPDYRSFSPASGARQEDRRSLEAVQEWAEEQRLNALALIDEMGDSPPLFSKNLKFDVGFDVEIAAGVSREAIGFSVKEQLEIKKSDIHTFPKILRDKIEEMGVLVLKESQITKFGVRGICFFANPLPVIVFGNESPSAQAFTLSHEFAHVLLGESGISGQSLLEKTSDHKTIEDWCNRFASAFLVPKSVLEGHIKKPKSPAEHIDPDKLRHLAAIFSISPHAMLIRLIRLGYVDQDFYWKKMRSFFLAEEENHKSFGKPQYYGKRYIGSRGRFYTGLVMSAWSEGYITAHNAAEYMGIKNFKHLQDIRGEYGF